MTRKINSLQISGRELKNLPAQGHPNRQYHRILFVGSGFVGAEIMNKAVKTMYNNKNSLQELVLQECQGGRLDLIFDEMCCLPQLKTLTLRWHDNSFRQSTQWLDSLQAALGATSTLEELAVGGWTRENSNLWIDTELASSIGHGLRMNRSVKTLVLQQLVFEGTEAMSHLIEGVAANRSIEVVKLGRCWLQEDISRDDGTSAMRALISAFREDTKPLQYAFEVHLVSETLEGISSILPNLQSLTLFDVDEEIDQNQLLSVLASAPSLQKLEIVRFGLPLWFTEVLAAALTSSTCSIRTLQISGAHLVEGRATLEKHLPEMKNLVELKFLGCNKRVGGFSDSVEDSLEGNYSLEVLEYNGKCGPSLYADLNWAGRGKLRGVDTSPSMWPFILARTDALVGKVDGTRRRAQAIFFMLQEHGNVIFAP